MIRKVERTCGVVRLTDCVTRTMTEFELPFPAKVYPCAAVMQSSRFREQSAIYSPFCGLVHTTSVLPTERKDSKRDNIRVTNFTLYKDNKKCIYYHSSYRSICGIIIAVNPLMKILTLFLALFLTMMPESVPIFNISQGQEICLEEVDDVEEEAVVSMSQRIQKRIGTWNE